MYDGVDAEAEFEEELAHIPRGVPGSGQEAFRTTYIELRTRQLRDDPDAAPTDSLRDALRVFREQHPHLIVRYDEAYFS
ncbi:MAG TPA: hypothetical protein VFB34_12330 [Chloroflexota bacterium]|nr:hypothetical protein [Chloroflexota bacterium]